MRLPAWIPAIDRRRTDTPPRTLARIGIACLLLSLSVARTARAEDAPPASQGDGPPSGAPLVDVSVRRVTGLPTLETRSVNAWLQVPCVLPCTLRLDPARDYRISGDGVIDSDPFRIPSGLERVRVDVSPGSPWVRDLGTVFTIGGLLFAAGGGAILFLPQDAGASGEAKTDKAIVGAGFVTMGVLAAALGVVLRIVSDTSVDVHPATVAAR